MHPFPFSVTLHADNAQYVNDRTDGCGSTPLEALADALETMAQGDGPEAAAARSIPYPLPREMVAEALGIDESEIDHDICDELDIPEEDHEYSECYWYVALELES